ncbi:MAG: hypothetical protein QNJ53_01080 [Pleurocapsa sp. MO_192.B19]|nr:hypothetical protein [Pleurocapsa sp. MO_192.B19]
MESYRLSEAIEAYTKAIAIKPNAFYYLSRSTAVLMKGDLQQGKADIKRAREINPEFMSQESWSDLLENFPDMENSPELEKLLQNFSDL